MPDERWKSGALPINTIGFAPAMGESDLPEVIAAAAEALDISEKIQNAAVSAGLSQAGGFVAAVLIRSRLMATPGGGGPVYVLSPTRIFNKEDCRVPSATATVKLESRK